MSIAALHFLTKKGTLCPLIVLWIAVPLFAVDRPVEAPELLMVDSANEGCLINVDIIFFPESLGDGIKDETLYSIG